MLLTRERVKRDSEVTDCLISAFEHPNIEGRMLEIIYNNNKIYKSICLRHISINITIQRRIALYMNI